MECQSMLFVKNHIPVPYRWDLSNSFSNSFINFYSYEGFHQVIYLKEWSVKLRIDNGGWHETLNLLHVSRCEMLHFVTKQNKSRKQTLKSAQYRLEISFKMRHKTLFYSLSRKTVNTRENLWNVYCLMTNQMRDETAKDNGKTTAGISHNLKRNNELALSSTRNLQFSHCISLKKLFFFTTNQH